MFPIFVANAQHLFCSLAAFVIEQLWMCAIIDKQCIDNKN